MCIATPMQLVAVDGLRALAEAGDQRAWISLALTGPLPEGAFVLAHLGSALRPLDPEEARQIEDALLAAEAAAAGLPFEHLIADLIDREPELPEHLRAAASPNRASPARASTPTSTSTQGARP